MGVVSGALRRGCRCLLPLLVGGALSACTGPNAWFMQGGLGSDGGGSLDGRVPAGGSGGGGSGGSGGAPGTGGAGGVGTGGTGGAGTGGATGGSGGSVSTGGSPGSGGTSGGASGSGGAGNGGATVAGGSGGTSATGGAVGVGGATGGAAGATVGGTGGGGAAGAGGGGTGGSAVDASPDTSDAGAPPAACGSGTASVTTISGARGIAIDRTGIIFYTRESAGRAYIGRIRPGAMPEPSWFSVPTAGSTPRILRTDHQRGYVVVADPALQGGVAYTLGLTTDAPYVVQSVTAITGIHGLAVAADGGVFMSRSDGHIWRWRPDAYDLIIGPVTTGPIFPAGQRVLGMAFGVDGQLYMGSSNGGIKRARVMQTGDTVRLMDVVDYGSFNGAANDLAVDVDGRIYVADHTGITGARLAIVPPGGVGAPMRVDAVLGRLSGLAWGRGPFRCDDLYVTDVGGTVRRYAAGHLALDLP
jgi:hypothetical protein